MSIDKIHIDWQSGMAFDVEVNGHKMVVDAYPEVGGMDKGPRPKTLMLVALAGCTGMDVVSILKKMRVDLEGLRIWVEGELTKEHPKHYSSMKVIYEFKGKNLPMDKLEKAVKLSEETYCGVSAVYRKAMALSSEIWVIE